MVAKFGESYTAIILEKKGLLILSRNWRYRRGEIDLISLKDRTLYTVEVKTRKFNKRPLYHPFDSIDSNKKKILQKTINKFKEKYYPTLTRMRVKILFYFTDGD